MILNYELWNRTEKPINEIPKVLLLHGMGGTGSLWRPIASGLESEMAVLASDQRGHGKSIISGMIGSRNPPTYTPLDFAQDVIETLGSLAFHPTCVVGHSMGVRTAVAFAYLSPSWVQSLVLVDLGFAGPA